MDRWGDLIPDLDWDLDDESWDFEEDYDRELAGVR